MRLEKEEYKRHLVSIVKDCNLQNVGTQRTMARIQETIDLNKIKDGQFDRVQTQLKELENIEGQLLSKIYDYKEAATKEETEEAREVAIKFKLERMDPRRPIIQWEKSVNTRRRNELSRKTRMINKGKDAGL
jgi:hypothetical protein